MKRLRLTCAVFFGWLFVLYNIERLHKPINLASFIYVLAALVAVPIILFPRLHRMHLIWLLAPVLPLVVALKAWLDYPLAGAALPITLTELAAVALTLALARQIGQSLEEFRNAAVSTLVSHLHERTRPFEKGQAEIYREIRRARRFHRPLALLAVSPTVESVQHSLDRFTREVQQESVHTYIHARLAELLEGETSDSDIITHRDNHFITVLPELGPDRVQQLTEKLRQSARDKLGLDLRIGVSLFPEQESTFVRLLERAQAQIDAPRRAAQPDLSGDSDGEPDLLEAAADSDWHHEPAPTAGLQEAIRNAPR